MNNPGPQYPGVLQGFQGELPLAADNLLPGVVSRAARNIDYRDQTLRKRGGAARLTPFGLYRGGAWFNYDGAGRYGETLNVLALSASLNTYEMVVRPLFNTVDSPIVCMLHSHTSGFGNLVHVQKSGSDYILQARVYHSGGVLSVDGPVVASGTAYTVTWQFDTGTNILTLTVNGVDYSDTIGANTYNQPAQKIYIGGVQSATDYDTSVIIGELRVWDGTVAVSLQDALRAPTAAETTAALVRRWPFLVGGISGSGYWYWGDSTFTTANQLLVKGSYLSPFGHGGPGIVVDDGYQDDIEAIIGVPGADQQGAQYVYAATREAVYRVWLSSVQSPSLYGLIGGKRRTLPFRTQLLNYMGYIIALNGSAENLIVGGNGGLMDVHQLSYAAPVLTSGLTITSVGSGGSVGSGVYQYLFSIYNSTTGVESAVATQVSTGTGVGSDTLTLDFTTGGFMPLRYFPGADKIRIYRTKVGGSAYYFLADVAITSTDYDDTAADSSLTSAYSPYQGYAGPSRFGFELNGALWLGNQEDNPSRLVYTEPDRLGAFYSDNYIDLAPGDGDVLTAGYALNNRGYVFKRRSIWLVTGAGSTVQAQRIAQGVGCVQQATLAPTGTHLYFLSETGIWRIGLQDGGGLEPVSPPAWRSTFEAMNHTDWEYCWGVWDPTSRRYLLGIHWDPSAANTTPTRAMVVYHEETGALARWDLDGTAGAYIPRQNSDRSLGDERYPALVVGLRNHVCVLERGQSDGGYVDGSLTLTGTATGGSATTLVNSGAGWTANKLANLEVTVWDADGANEQTRVIAYNDSTTITVTAAWDSNPGAGWTYHLGAIAAYWTSPRMGLDRWDREKRIDRVRVLREALADDDVEFYASCDGGAETTWALTANTRYEDLALGVGCKEISVGIRDTSADKGFEVAGIGLGMVQQEGR